MSAYAAPSGRAYTLYQTALAQPHLMIAGATGSGKSVVVNALIYTALYRLPLDIENGVNFILIDPKRVELVQYRDLPHTLYYASEPDGMIAALNYAMELTETRYKAMQKQGVRKYTGSDVYVIIDEFADLMTTNRRKVAPLVQRLAQIGRAARVHIILCTQCPIVKVIPTEIKVNFDARFGLRTRCAQDSRNILGESCCELLPRYGQGYYMSPDTIDGPELYVIPMIPDAEIDSRVSWWMKQKPVGRWLRGLFRR